jgi:hypothetical protein
MINHYLILNNYKMTDKTLSNHKRELIQTTYTIVTWRRVTLWKLIRRNKYIWQLNDYCVLIYYN